MRGGLILPGVLLLAACGSLPEAPKQQPEPQPEVGEAPKMKNSTLKYLANRNLKPQPTRPLNVKSKCSHRDAIGTLTRLDLLVQNADVKTLDAQISMKSHGSCQFRLKDFVQEAHLPQALLRHRQESECTLRLWEQGNNVTLAFNSCPKSCEGKAFDYLWPVVIDARNGRCH